MIRVLNWHVKLRPEFLYLIVCCLQVYSLVYFNWCLMIAFIYAETCSTINKILLKLF